MTAKIDFVSEGEVSIREFVSPGINEFQAILEAGLKDIYEKYPAEQIIAVYGLGQDMWKDLSEVYGHDLLGRFNLYCNFLDERRLVREVWIFKKSVADLIFPVESMPDDSE